MYLAQIEDVISKIEIIPSDRNYWLVRTMGGLYYDDFLNRNFIALGYDKISYFEISEAMKFGLKANEILAESIKRYYPKEIRPKYIARQIIQFAYHIKKGDIVIIPSSNSSTLSFGEVSETPIKIVEEQPDLDNPNKCTFSKRKSINWVKTLYREKLDPNLYKLLYSHHAVTEAIQYANYIDKELSSFYIKNDIAHIIIEVKTRKNIKARELFKFGNDLLDDVDEYCEALNISNDTSDIFVKTNLNSPGKIEFSGKQKSVVTIIGIALLSVTGGGLKINVNDKFNLDLSTNGLIQKIIDYQNSNSDRIMKKQLLEKHSNELQLCSPEDLVKILQEQNSKEVEFKRLDNSTSNNNNEPNGEITEK